VGSSPYRGGGERGGRRGPSLPPRRAGENTPGYEPRQAADLPRAAPGPGWTTRPPATPHGQPRPAAPQAPHGQPRPAAPQAPHGQPRPAAPQAPHGQPRPAAPYRQPGSPPSQPPSAPHSQDPRWAGRTPGSATATSPLPPGPLAPNQFGPHPPGPQGLGSPARPKDPRGGAVAQKKKKKLLTGIAVVAVALIGSIAIIITRHPGGTAGHPARSAPAGSQGTGSGAADHGSSGGAAAQHQITTAMIFPRAHVVAGGIKFGRVTAVLNKECALTARGAFASALTSAGCQRVVRATFVDNAKRYAVTAGVAELSSAAAASQADRARKFRPDVWFTGLDGPAHSGATAVSKSVGLGYNIVYGRYIVYSLATYSSGRNPAGHAAAVRTLKNLARSFAVMSRRPLTTHGN
jgi:hypothetical protein